MINTIQVGDKTFENFIPYHKISNRIGEIAIELNNNYEGKKPLFIGVLNGCFLFFADLIKEIDIECEVAFMRVSSYKGTESTGNLKELLGLPENLENRDIIIVEDIVDTGLTMKYIIDTIDKQNPSSINVCSLLLKPESLKAEISELNYIGFEIPNDFVVGYGLDYDELGRNLKDIYKATD